MEENIQCGGFTFYNNFDSANLASVEKVDIIDNGINKAENGKKDENNKTNKNATNESPSYEFDLWTKQDCHGTQFQNNNRTWFYFGVKAATPGVVVKLNLVNLNKQIKMFSQGMCPVYKVLPGHPHWERIKDKPTFIADDKNGEFLLSFNYRTSENPNAVHYFAFTYPFSYTDLQTYLKKIDIKMGKQKTHFADDIYYHRECAIKSIEKRRLDILTISSYYNITKEREAKIKDLFPEENDERPFKFHDKKIIFLSARVHPGETPSSFVLNGFINFLLNRDDQIAVTLRRLYVFKLIPMLNPDGVAQGYYRMDTRGVNLNRLYLNPSKIDHPTIFAAKCLLRYYHHSYNLPEDLVPDTAHKKIGTSFDTSTISTFSSISNETNKLLQRVTSMTLEERKKCIEQGSLVRNLLQSDKAMLQSQGYMEDQSISSQSIETMDNIQKCSSGDKTNQLANSSGNSGIFLYIDFHGHASKKGIFMYGNHFDDPEDSSSCMLLPKLMSINNSNFHFTSCNFAEKNMYLVDKRDGMSREGSGRVAVYKLFGLIHSYTLECNYNTGRIVNAVPARVKEGYKVHGQLFAPPKYNPTVFEEVGAALGPSILDMTSNNPNSRLPNSQYRNLNGLKSYLKLISTNHYQQASLNKPLNKNNGGEQSRNSQDSTSDYVVNRGSLKSSTNSAINLSSKSNTQKFFRTANKLYGSIKKLKNNKAKRKNSNPDTKVIATKIITTHVQTKCKLVPPKKVLVNTKSNFAQNKAIKHNKIKTIENNSRIKLPVKNLLKKSTIIKKATIIKKPGPQKLKTSAMSKIRYKLKSEHGEATKIHSIKVVSTPVITPHIKQKRKKHSISKMKKHPEKHKSQKSSSSMKV